MTELRFQAAMVITTMVAFVAMLIANEWLFTRLEFVPGINWIFLPAGMRLLCVLLFGNAGALGLLLVSWLVSFFFFFPDGIRLPARCCTTFGLPCMATPTTCCTAAS